MPSFNFKRLCLQIKLATTVGVRPAWGLLFKAAGSSTPPPDMGYESYNTGSEFPAILESLRKDGPNALLHVPAAVLSNREFMLRAVSVNANALYHASRELQNDEEFVVAAVRGSDLSLRMLPRKWGRNRRVVLAAVSKLGRDLFYADSTFYNDRTVVLAAAAADGGVLTPTSSGWLPSRMRNDKDIVLAAVRNYPQLLTSYSNSFSEEVRSDPDILLAVIRGRSRAQLGPLSWLVPQDAPVRRDVNFLFAAFESNPKQKYTDVAHLPRFSVAPWDEGGEAAAAAESQFLQKVSDPEYLLGLVRADTGALLNRADFPQDHARRRDVDFLTRCFEANPDIRYTSVADWAAKGGAEGKTARDEFLRRVSDPEYLLALAAENGKFLEKANFRRTHPLREDVDFLTSCFHASAEVTVRELASWASDTGDVRKELWERLAVPFLALSVEIDVADGHPEDSTFRLFTLAGEPLSDAPVSPDQVWDTVKACDEFEQLELRVARLQGDPTAAGEWVEFMAVGSDEDLSRCPEQWWRAFTDENKRLYARNCAKRAALRAEQRETRLAKLYVQGCVQRAALRASQGEARQAYVQDCVQRAALKASQREARMAKLYVQDCVQRAALKASQREARMAKLYVQDCVQRAALKASQREEGHPATGGQGQENPETVVAPRWRPLWARDYRILAAIVRCLCPA